MAFIRVRLDLCSETVFWVITLGEMLGRPLRLADSVSTYNYHPGLVRRFFSCN